MQTPHPPRARRHLRHALLALTLAAPDSASAACSRELQVPVTATGASIIVKDRAVSGIFPEMLRTQGAKDGCRFAFSAVPRARQEALFESGQSDLLLPAVPTPRRDRADTFVPLVGNRPLLITLKGRHPPMRTAAELMAQREMRVAVVRGFDYGPVYQDLLKQLAAQGRLFEEVDVLSVARLLQAGLADATLMSSTVMVGTVMSEPKVAGLLEQLHMEALQELPWTYLGAYVSKLALSRQDQTALREMLERSASADLVMAGFLRYHPHEVVKLSVRPR